MKGKFLLWVLLMFSLVSLASAVTIPDPYAYWNCEESNGKINDTGLANSFNATPIGGIVYQVAGIHNYGVQTNQSSGFNLTWGNGDFYQKNALTIVGWFNFTGLPSNGRCIGCGYGGAPENYLYWMYTGDGGAPANKIGGVIQSDNWYANTDWSTLADSVYHHMAWVFSGTSIQIYKDGVPYTMTDGAIGIANNSQNVDLGIGLRVRGDTGSYDEIQWANFSFDELAIINANLTKAQIVDLYNQTSGTEGRFWDGGQWSVTTVSADSLNLSLPYLPTNNSQFNVNDLNFNLSFNSSTSASCRLWINGVVNLSSASFSSGSGLFVNFSLNNVLSEGTWTWFIECNNTNTDKNSSNFLFYVDVTDPIISSNFVNNSVYYLTNFSDVQFNFSDNLMLHSYNISLSNGTQLAGASGLTVNSVNYSLNYSLNSLTTGIWGLNVRVADGHTSNKLLGEYSWSNGIIFSDYLKFEFDQPYNDAWIEIEQKDGNLLDSWSAIQKTDRYSLVFEPNTLASEYKFTIKTSVPQYIVRKPESDYQEWIIFDDHWLDFVLGLGEKISINKINEYESEITITNLPKQEQYIFNSIGDLNIITKNYTFYKTNISTTYTDPVIEGSIQTITLTINKTTNITTSATLIYNNTARTVTKTAYSNYDLFSSTITIPKINPESLQKSMIWTYNITSIGSSETGNFSNNHTIYKLLITNCTSDFTNTTAINFTIKDEATNAIVNGTTSIDLNVTYGTVNRKYTLYYELNHNPQVCISPSWINITSTTTAYYSSTGYSEREYNQNNQILNNETQQVNLYLLSTGNTTNIDFTLIDQNNAELKGYIIEAWKREITTGNFSLVATGKTNFDGLTTMNLQLNEIFMFKIYDTTGNLVYTTIPAFKLTETSYIFQITIGSAIGIKGLVDVLYFNGGLTYDNNTQTFTLNWDDPNSVTSQICLRVEEWSTNVTVLLNNCSTSSSSSLTYVIGASEGTFKALGIATSVEDDLNYIFDEKTIKIYQNIFGDDGVFLGILTFLLCLMAGIANIFMGFALGMLGLVLGINIGLVQISIASIIGLCCVTIIALIKGAK